MAFAHKETLMPNLLADTSLSITSNLQLSWVVSA